MKHICKELQNSTFVSAREKAEALFSTREPSMPIGKRFSDSSRVEYFRTLSELYKDPEFSIVPFVSRCSRCHQILPLDEEVLVAHYLQSMRVKK